MPLDSTLARAVAAGASFAVAAALLAGCGTAAQPSAVSPSESAQADAPTPDAPTPDEPASTGDGPTTPAGEAPVSVPQQLDFSAETVDGGSFDARSLAGQDALVYFWAPWCSVCRREAPGLVDWLSSYDDLAFVTVGGRSGDPSAMTDFVADVGFDDVTNVADLSGDVWTRFEVTYQPTYAFVDDSGTIEIVPGPLDKSDLGERIDALLAT